MTGRDHFAPSLASVRDAAAAIAEQTVRTPTVDAPWLSPAGGGRLALKVECLQRTGSFKVRGVAARLAALERDDRGVITASAGNHGQALAYVARLRGIDCRVLMPTTAAVSKVRAVRRWGADLELYDHSVDWCLTRAREVAEEDELTFVHPFDDPAVVRGQATLGLEILDQVHDLATLIVPVGGGGLAGGVSAAVKQLKQDVQIVGVQAEVCAPLAGGTAEAPDLRHALADGIAIKRPGELTTPLIEHFVDDLCVVSEDSIAEAVALLLEHGKLVVEGAGAVSVAALVGGHVETSARGSTVAILSGGNIDPRQLTSVLRMHEAGRDANCHIATTVPDHPGGLVALLSAVARAGANVVSIEHVRDAGPRGFHETGVELVLETRDRQHKDAVLGRLTELGYEPLAVPAPEPSRPRGIADAL